MKILVIALSGIGDALMFTPSLNKLSEDFPSAQIDALVMYKGVKDIYEKLSHVTKVHYWDFINNSKFASLWFVLRLRKKYDVTINIYPSNRKEYNLISFLLGSGKRAAVKYLRKDFFNFGFLNNYRVIENDSLHNVEENINMCELLSGKKSQSISPLQLTLTQEDHEFANSFFKENNIDTNEIIISFHPGCSPLKNHDKRRWETYKFAELAKILVQYHNANVLLFGGPEEDYLKNEVLKLHSNKTFNVTTKSLTQTSAIIKRCNLFVTNDSSLMHVASALSLDVVAIIGPTNINYIYPWKTNYKTASLDLDCSPCFYYSPKPLTCSRNDLQFKCIKDLDVNTVYSKVKEFLF